MRRHVNLPALTIASFFVATAVPAYGQVTLGPLPGFSPNTGAGDDLGEVRVLSEDFTEKLVNNGAKKILLLAFEEATSLGSWRGVSGGLLADRFSDALSRTELGLTVLDRHRYTRALDRLYERAEDSFSEPDVQSIGRAVGADTVVEGQYMLLGGKFHVTISAYRVVDIVHCIAVQVGVFAFPSILEARTPHWAVLGPHVGTFNEQPTPNQEKPYTEPECVSCPMPSFRVDGPADEVQGLVLLAAIITTRGRATHITVLGSLTPERDRQAVRAVENWTFKPATKILGGAPVAMQVPIEVIFRPE